VAILDDEAQLTVCAYIDLNPVAAGIAGVPETNKHMSIKQRVDHVQAQGRSDDLAAARAGSVAGSAAAGIEESLWLCPIEDRRGLDSSREGMVEGFSRGNYLPLVDYTGWLFREGKATISGEVAEILQRLGNSALGWQARLEQLKRRGGRLLGRFFALRESGCVRWRSSAACTTWPTWAAARPAELNRGHESGLPAASVRS
jgi:hypothetical protein